MTSKENEMDTQELSADLGVELVIGLVGALGVDMDLLQGLISKYIESVGFNAVTIHLSQLMKDIDGFTLHESAQDEAYDKRVFGLMESGNHLRELLGGDSLAKLAILRIRDHREVHGKDPDKPLNKTAYILRSLKHPDEVKLLRQVYGDSFFLFSAYSPRDQRIENVKDKIRKSDAGHKSDPYEAEAIKLVQKDEEETDNANGQQVRRTFWRGDAFVDMTKIASAKQSIKRIVHLWFGSPYITPSRDEMAMFCAVAAAYRSAAMGRQVGAIIATAEGSIVATGTNEVPKAKGGQFWEGDENDNRDHIRGFDSSDTMRRELLEDSLKRLILCGWKPPKDFGTKILADELLNDPRMLSGELQALTEYQRAVHAEMSALMDAVNRGISVAGYTLYCTTFPCHACARHIVASGIVRVVYIEPYTKSLVKTLYSDSISIEEKCLDDRVRFVPYMGLAPRRYLNLFQMNTRKNKAGLILTWNPLQSAPRLNGWESWLSIDKENRIVVELRLLMSRANLLSSEGDK